MAVRFASGGSTSNLTYTIGSQLCIPSLLAALRAIPLASDAVSDVVFRQTDVQMIGIHAGRVIAMVQGPFASLKRELEQFHRDPVSAKLLPSKSQDAVPGIVSRPLPFPAFIRGAVRWQVAHEAIQQGFGSLRIVVTLFRAKASFATCSPGWRKIELLPACLTLETIPNRLADTAPILHIARLRTKAAKAALGVGWMNLEVLAASGADALNTLNTAANAATGVAAILCRRAGGCDFEGRMTDLTMEGNGGRATFGGHRSGPFARVSRLGMFHHRRGFTYPKYTRNPHEIGEIEALAVMA